MLKKIFAIIILISFSSLGMTQKQSANKKSCGCSFTSINQLGLLAGEKNEAFQVQTINGFQYRTWMVGAGVGIDGYRFRSIPLFLQLRKEFNFKSNAIFIYNDIGINYPWLKTEQKAIWNAGDYHHGVYYDGGVGYKIILKRHSVVFGGGFSLKEFRENRTSSFCPFFGPCNDQVDEYFYSLKRITLKLGVQL